MTEPGDVDFPAYLEGEVAVEWFKHTKGGYEIYDRHLAAIIEIFGGDAIRSVRAVTDPRNGKPQTLIMHVGDPGMDEEQSWSLMLRVQAQLIEQGEQLREQFKVDPFGRIALTLGSTSESWEDFAGRIERES